MGLMPIKTIKLITLTIIQDKTLIVEIRIYQ